MHREEEEGQQHVVMHNTHRTTLMAAAEAHAGTSCSIFTTVQEASNLEYWQTTPHYTVFTSIGAAQLLSSHSAACSCHSKMTHD
jgi:hypothetical protein